MTLSWKDISARAMQFSKKDAAGTDKSPQQPRPRGQGRLRRQKLRHRSRAGGGFDGTVQQVGIYLSVA